FHIKQRDERDNKSRISLKFKNVIRGECATVQEYNSLPGEHDRYTEPLIIQKHRQQREREEEIRSRGQNFYQVMGQRDSKAYKSTKVERLFDPDEHGDIQRTVILQGHSGTGKSFTTQKIMSDWARERLYQDRLDFVFHLRCKELNQATGNKSVMDLLNYDQSLSSMIKQVLRQSPERVLFLVDGFDELKFPLDVPKDSLPRDPWTQCSPEETLSGLIRKQILPRVLPACHHQVHSAGQTEWSVRYAEIVGFSKEGVEEYFQRFFKNEQHSQQAYDTVRKNETLFTACFIPVICWIICTVYREQFEEGTEMIQSLETTTSIFVEFVATLLKHHSQDMGQSAPTILQGRGKLAEKGMEEQQVLFDHDSVSQTVSDPWTQLKHFILEVTEKGNEDQILHADDFVKEAMKTYTDIHLTGTPLTNTDCWVLMYCLQHCNSIESIGLSGCNLTAENMKILLPGLRKCKDLVLQVDDLADDDLDDLLTALGEGKSLELDLTENNFSDEKVQDLFVALTKHKPRNIESNTSPVIQQTN
ncbi:unnamed protein product, partial [Coregonus sp. 'balchen']